MSIIAHPIDYRYGSEELRRIFSPQNIIKTYALIEAVVAEVQAELGLIPKEAVPAIKQAAASVTFEEVDEEEKRIKHDIMALVSVMARKAGKWGEYIHWGLTSSDIKDTAMALLVRDALSYIEKKLRALIFLLSKLAYDNVDLPCVGRTHGVHANVYSFGHKFAVFADEFMRHLERLEEVKERVLVGKLSGAVGIHTALGEIGEEMERRALGELGLSVAEIATQVVPRDRLAELILVLSLLSSSLDKLATEIRNLQRTEIGEVEEPFHEEQVGSSTMPHKRNPILCESISGLARIIRSLTISALENIILWHERDLTNSSMERVLLPDVFLLIDEQLSKALRVLGGLRVNKERILRNLNWTKGLLFSEAVMMKLAEKGMGRQTAHSLVRKLAMKAYEKNLDFKDVLINNEEIRKYLSEDDIKKIFDATRYIVVAKKRVLRLIRRIEEKLGVSIIPKNL